LIATLTADFKNCIKVTPARTAKRDLIMLPDWTESLNEDPPGSHMQIVSRHASLGI
jgi:hypothetical protein